MTLLWIAAGAAALLGLDDLLGQRFVRKAVVAGAFRMRLGTLPTWLAWAYGDWESLRLAEPLRYGIYGPQGTTSLTYRGALDFIHRSTRALVDRVGIRPGDVVGICTENGPDFLLHAFAVSRAGAILVPMNHMLKAAEMRHVLEDSGAKALIVDRAVFDQNIKNRTSLPKVEHWLMAGPRASVPEGFQSLDLLMEEVGPGPSRAAPGSRTAPAAIFYTSGTTGLPKGATLTHKSLLSIARLTALAPHWKADLGIAVLPMAHIMGFASFLIGWIAGLPIRYLGRFDAEEVLEVIQREKVRYFLGVPAMYQMMLDAGAERYDLTSVRMWASAADAMPLDLMQRFKQMGATSLLGIRLGPAIFAEGYGMVELSGVAILRISPPWFDFASGCVGRPVLRYKVRILDDQGRKVRRGEVGELWVKGPGVTSGYWGRPEATQASLDTAGWFRTGDLARRSLLGFIYFVDRKKDMIKTGGYSVFTPEVEEEILRHPEIAEVGVFGVPHPIKKEVPVAVAALRDGSRLTEEELLAWCRENIAGYKCPRAVRIVPLSEMPYGATRKLLKRELKDRFAPSFRFASETPDREPPAEFPGVPPA